MTDPVFPIFKRFVFTGHTKGVQWSSHQQIIAQSCRFLIQKVPILLLSAVMSCQIDQYNNYTIIFITGIITNCTIAVYLQ